MSDTLRVSEYALNPEIEARALRERVPEAGAIVTFSGQVRGGHESEEVFSLVLQHYPKFTEARMQEIVDTAFERWSILDTQVVHRVGEILPAETIVFVGVASLHRREAFEAADYIMDFLKSDAPFWKKEKRSDGETWVEPRSQDYDDKARWAEKEG